ncbi:MULTISPECIES: hypothetical protein [unclassified Burkholderia]|uniref:hypothetical protein n=1 Tax=unclassified Burkholderia TaxID=2613784 RepID=UPI002AAF6D36|nr:MULTISPECIES: hypothetical protein [unclassified Burkholderia]
MRSQWPAFDAGRWLHDAYPILSYPGGLDGAMPDGPHRSASPSRSAGARPSRLTCGRVFFRRILGTSSVPPASATAFRRASLISLLHDFPAIRYAARASGDVMSYAPNNIFFFHFNFDL